MTAAERLALQAFNRDATPEEWAKVRLGLARVPGVAYRPLRMEREHDGAKGERWRWAEWRFKCPKCQKRCAECSQKLQYVMGFMAVRHILRRIAVWIKAGPEEKAKMKMEAIARPTVDNDEIGINTVLQESYDLFRSVVGGRITSQVAGAAARNCANVLKGLELRARFGPEALKF